MEKIKVLYLEDNHFFLDIVQLYASENYPYFDIINVDNVKDGRRIFSEEQFDAVICDYYLPEENGISFLKHIRETNNIVPVIFLTGADTTEVAIQALNNGADYFIEKSNLINGDENNFDRLFYQIEKIIKRKIENYSIYSEKDIKRRIELAFNITVHDIKNALTLIGLSTDSIEMIIGNMELAVGEQSKHAISKAIKNIHHSISTVKDFLYFYSEYRQLEKNEYSWQLVHEIIERTVNMFSPRITIENNVGSGICLYADKFLEKVFYNLFDNALSHGKATAINCYSCFRNEMLVISIADNGIGIPEEHKKLVFNRGYGKNTGYGLFFCSEVLLMTGIQIEENGKEGEGARFEIVVPRDRYRIN